MKENFAWDTLFLFRGLSKERIDSLLGDAVFTEKRFSASETVYSHDRFASALGFVYSGTLDVVRQKDGRRVRINRLSSGDSFGAAALFGEISDYPTHIIAATNAEILFFEQKEVERLLRADADVAMNYIAFLSDRIRFLNRRVLGFSAPDSESKVACFLLQNAKDGVYSVKNLTRLAEALSMGRASLYRILDALTEKAVIRRDKNTIFIINLLELERISKR